MSIEEEITIEPGRTMSNARELSQLANASIGFKNRLINGDFRIAQRTTGGSATPNAGATTYISLDRWFIAQTGTTASLFCGQIAGQTSQFAGRFGRSSGQTNVPATIFMGQQIESHNMYDLRGKRVTLSFKAYRGANAPTTLLCRARFGTGTDQASGGGITGSWTGFTQGTQATLNGVSTTAQSYSLSFDVPSDANEMNVLFFYAPSGTAGAEEWFGLEDVQLELGSVPTEFDRRSYGHELALCQRYFEELAPPPGSVNAYINNGTVWSSGQVESTIRFAVLKRANPTMTGVGNIRWTNMGGTYTQESGASFDIPTTVAVLVYANGLSGWTQGQCVRLITNSAGTTRIQASAEL